MLETRGIVSADAPELETRLIGTETLTVRSGPADRGVRPGAGASFRARG